MKKLIILITIGGITAIAVFVAISFLSIIPISKYDISVDPIITKDEMGTETHVAIKNTGMNALTNVIVYYGGTVKSYIIPILNPEEKISLSPPEGSELVEVRVTTDQGIDITKSTELLQVLVLLEIQAMEDSTNYPIESAYFFTISINFIAIFSASEFGSTEHRIMPYIPRGSVILFAFSYFAMA